MSVVNKVICKTGPSYAVNIILKADNLLNTCSSEMYYIVHEDLLDME